MPHVDALSLAAAMQERTRVVPLLVLSSNLTSLKDDPRATGFAAMLQKPLPRRALFTELKKIAPVAVTAPPELRKMRVLAAEDNRTNQLVFGKMVKSLNITLEFAANGEEAVALYQSFKPDLVFMDISMPRMDGKEATQEIRKLEAISGVHIPVVAMTAHALPDDDKSILQAGLDHYLTKPLRRAALEEHILLAQPKDTFPVIPLPDQAAG